MPIYLQRLTETAIRPTRATAGAAGLDLYADETVTIPEYRRAWVSTGIAVAVAPGYCGLVVSENESLIANKIISSDDRTEIKLSLWNSTPHKKSIHRGDIIGKLITIPYIIQNIIEVEKLP